MGQKRLSRLCGAGVFAALAVAAMACSNDGDGGGGTANFNQNSAFNGTVLSLAPAGDGSGDLYVGGSFTSYRGTSVPRLARLNADGTVDTAFATGTGFDDTVYSIAPAGDGSGDLYVGGDFTSYRGTSAPRLVRLNADGTVDTAFAAGTGFTDTVYSIAPAGDGSGDLYVGGAFTSYRGTSAARLARLNADGTVDTAFVTGTGFTNTVYSIAPAGDGSGELYVGGSFASYNGTPANDLVRLNANGMMDAAFATGAGFNDTVFSIAPAGDGSGDLFVGGQFTSYQSITTGGIVRLKSNGSAIN